MEYIYKITNPKGLIYIGKTNNPIERLKCYKYMKCKSQPRIYNSIQKYGWNNHKFDIILRTTNSSEAEIKLIEYYNSFNSGLNLTTGGEGIQITDDIRRKMSVAKIGKPGNRKGIKCSDHTKFLISKSQKGKPSNNRKAVYQFDTHGNFIKEWNSVTEAANFYNIVSSSINNNIKGLTKTSCKFVWKYK